MRRFVELRSHHRCHQLIITYSPWKSKVGQFQNTILDEDVLWFHISMNNICDYQSIKPQKNLSHKLYCLSLRYPLMFLQILFQILITFLLYYVIIVFCWDNVLQNHNMIRTQFVLNDGFSLQSRELIGCFFGIVF